MLEKKDSRKPKVAIACQGGGSQTAFTAGVLKALFENKIQDHFNIVSLSGTSGGALCAFFIWYALKKGDECMWKRMIDFWKDNTAQSFQERFFNYFVISMLEMTSRGSIPQFNLSPSSPLLKACLSFATLGMRSRFTDLKEMLECHIDPLELASWNAQSEPPILILGACNILTGKLRKFNSYQEPIRIEHLLASACIPNVFPAVIIDDMAYWDGIFSDNPPIKSFLMPDLVGPGNIPQEIWVIKINPTRRDKIPATPSDIVDRRNELEGNVSLFQNLRAIENIKLLYSRNAFRDEYLTELDMKEPVKFPKSFSEDPDLPYHIPMIEMSEELAQSINYVSKLDRSPEHVRRLIQDGEKQGQKFIEARLSKGDA
ncbi:MAG: patatin-like phospholipase family protein [Smithella sp.]